MMVVTRNLGSGHCITVFGVQRWRPIYRYFNYIFARATRRHEYAITDIGSDLYKALANQRAK